MGRVGYVGSLFGSKVYTPLDMFRYQSPGVRNLSVGSATAYFSIDGGVTNFGIYNNPITGGDASDWEAGTAGDSYGVAYAGTAAVVTPYDLIEVSTLGYLMTNSALTFTQPVPLP